jgi:hypothetical protein
MHFVTKVSLQFEIYAQNGFCISKMTHFETKIATSIFHFSAAPAAGKNFDAAPAPPLLYTVVPSELF